MRDVELSAVDGPSDSSTGRTFLCSAGRSFDATLFRSEVLNTPFVTHARSRDSALALDSDFEDVRQATRVCPNCERVERPFKVAAEWGVGNSAAFSSIISNISGSPAACNRIIC